ncbi:MAG: PAS domain S-box protein [Cyanobacteriota bacterium]
MIRKDEGEQKIIIGVGLALFLISGASIFSGWNLIGGVSLASRLNPMLIVATLTSLSWVLVSAVFILMLRSRLTRLRSETEGNWTELERDALQASAQHFFNLSLELLAISNFDGYFTHLNPAWEKILGFDLHELKNQPFIAFVHPDDVEATQVEMKKLEAGIPLASFEHRYRRKDGSYRWLSWTAMPRLEEGLIYGIAHDISDRKEAEAILQRTNEELEIRVAERTAALKQANDELVTEIVEHRQVEIALRKSAAELASSEERFRTCIENMLDCFGIYRAIRDESGEIVDFAIEYVNAAACVNNRMMKEEQIGQRLCELLPTHYANGLFEEYCQLVETGQPLLKESIYYEDTYKSQNINRAFNICAVKLGDGFACAWRDVTERMQAEEALRKTEELYRTLVCNFPNGVVALYDKDLRYTLTEGKGLTEAGLNKAFLEGKTLAEIFPPEVCQIKERAYRAALDGNANVCEIPFGEQYYVMYSLPVRNEWGEIYAGMSMSQDISDRKRAELALIEERNFISAILDTANALIIVLDEQGRIVRFNRACEQLTGHSFDEVKRQYFWDFLLLSEEVESVKAVFRNLLLGQYPNEHENYWVAKDGTRRLLSWSNTVLRDTDGSIKYIIGIGIDITDRKRAEEMRRALEREQELSELRFRFFAMASHEFRTPLSTILLTAQLLNASAQEWSPQKSQRNLQRIESAAKTMRQMLDDILTINRAETGKLDFNPIPLDVEQFCRSLLEEMKRCASPQHIFTFISEISEQQISVDEKIIRCILTHLLSNAIKYSPQGGEIALVLSGVGEEIQVQVRDRGIGIPLSDQPHLFEAFYRGENIDSISGSGLGLTVVKKYVELHRGRITFTSEVGMGTTFTVTIPY